MATNAMNEYGRVDTVTDDVLTRRRNQRNSYAKTGGGDPIPVLKDRTLAEQLKDACNSDSDEALGT